MFTIVVNISWCNPELVENLCQEIERLLANHEADGEVNEFSVESSNDEE